METTNSQFDFSKLSESFQALLFSPESIFQIFDTLPIPIEIFSQDGLMIFINQAFLDIIGVQDANLLVGKYNVLNDPVCNDQLGHRDSIESDVFVAQMVVAHDGIVFGFLNAEYCHTDTPFIDS